MPHATREPLHLEPRVAKLELGMERITADIKELSGAVASQGERVETQIQQLVIAVTQAQSPKKTDWQTIIAAIALIMAIGSAVFWPLSQQVTEARDELAKYHDSMAQHVKLDMHPVGWALVQRMEQQLQSHISNNEKEFRNHVDLDEREFADIHAEFKEKLMCLKNDLENQVKYTQEKNAQYLDKLFGRVVKLEDGQLMKYEKEITELMEWRQKAMGLTTQATEAPPK